MKVTHSVCQLRNVSNASPCISFSSFSTIILVYMTFSSTAVLCRYSIYICFGVPFQLYSLHICTFIFIFDEDFFVVHFIGDRSRNAKVIVFWEYTYIRVPVAQLLKHYDSNTDANVKMKKIIQRFFIQRFS